jgi:serine/threonine-protein phosphatase 2B catalytic subunit
MANERLPEFNYSPTTFPYVPVPSMRQTHTGHTQRAWGSGSSSPTGEGDATTPEVSPAAAGPSTGVPGAWPSPMAMDEDGNSGFVERMADRLAYGRRATDRPPAPKRHETA